MALPRLLAATAIALAATAAAALLPLPALGQAPETGVCAEGQGALDFGLPDVAVTALTRCLAEGGLNTRKRSEILAARGHAYLA
ncbi:MAG TPA: hypothetical protein EYH07_16890, partial [Kiloniellaceae bacterium]|nr:hypothetical protein [Kiloniellaceae bacterium]